MTQPNQSFLSAWPLWQKIAFRFFFIYFFLTIAPWGWLYDVPGVNYITQYYYLVLNWMVDLINQHLLHFKPTTIVNNGSGDTSERWKNMFSLLILAGIGCLLWSLVDRKRKSYVQANYWLRVFLRYFLILNCISYGLYKLYALQMSFPNQSQLATPLGDLLPMRFSWMFIGYSTPYQFFSGAMEAVAGLLLLNRKTITLGVMLSLAVFTNVMVLNLCYDIPVKISSMHLVIYSVYLLLADGKRLLDFFVFNKPTNANSIDYIPYPKKWMRITRIVLKLAFVGLFVIKPFFKVSALHKTVRTPANIAPLKPGIYDVVVFAVNKDTIPALISDTLRWQNIIFETDGIGSVASRDTAFRQRYRRGYFNLSVDSTNQTISLKKSQAAKGFIADFHFTLPDSNTITLKGSKGKDSVYILLKRSNRHFQLAERQFHWISEANR
jgi:hypothetical protein